MPRAPLSLPGSPSKGHHGSSTVKHSWPLAWKQKNEGEGSVAEHSPSMVGHGFHCQHCETNQGRQREGRDQAEPSLYCCVYRKTKASQRSSAAPCPVQTDDVAHQRSQGQAPALSYEREALCRAICSLDTTLVYKKNKKQEKNKAWPITPTVCGDHLSSEPTV